MFLGRLSGAAVLATAYLLTCQAAGSGPFLRSTIHGPYSMRMNDRAPSLMLAQHDSDEPLAPYPLKRQLAQIFDKQALADAEEEEMGPPPAAAVAATDDGGDGGAKKKKKVKKGKVEEDGDVPVEEEAVEGEAPVKPKKLPVTPDDDEAGAVVDGGDGGVAHRKTKKPKADDEEDGDGGEGEAMTKARKQKKKRAGGDDDATMPAEEEGEAKPTRHHKKPHTKKPAEEEEEEVDPDMPLPDGVTEDDSTTATNHHNHNHTTTAPPSDNLEDPEENLHAFPTSTVDCHPSALPEYEALVNDATCKPVLSKFYDATTGDGFDIDHIDERHNNKVYWRSDKGRVAIMDGLCKSKCGGLYTKYMMAAKAQDVICDSGMTYMLKENEAGMPLLASLGAGSKNQVKVKRDEDWQMDDADDASRPSEDLSYFGNVVRVGGEGTYKPTGKYPGLMLGCTKAADGQYCAVKKAAMNEKGGCSLYRSCCYGEMLQGVVGVERLIKKIEKKCPGSKEYVTKLCRH